MNRYILSLLSLRRFGVVGLCSRRRRDRLESDAQPGDHRYAVEAQSGQPDARDGDDERGDLRRVSGDRSHARAVQVQHASARRQS